MRASFAHVAFTKQFARFKYSYELCEISSTRMEEHTDLNKQSEPAKHIKERPNHTFSWEVLANVHSWMKRRITEAFYIARFHPELNKQVQSTQLTLPPYWN